MTHAIWNGAVIADAPDDQVEHVEGNVYFPRSAVNMDLLKESHTHARALARAAARDGLATLVPERVQRRCTKQLDRFFGGTLDLIASSPYRCCGIDDV